MYKVNKIFIFWQQYDDDGNLNEVVVREIARLYIDENEVNKLVAECSVISK